MGILSIDWSSVNNKPDFASLYSPVGHNHDASYYTKPQVDAAIASVDLSGRVPYTGATGPVNLGIHGLTAGSVKAVVGSALSGVVVGNSLSAMAGIGFYSNGTRMALYADNAVAMLLGNSTNIMANGRPLVFSTDASGLGDTSIRRNATGPTLETWAAGGLKVCNADGSVLQSIACSGVSNSTTGVTIGHATQGWTPIGPVNNAMASHQGHWSLAYHGVAGATNAPMTVGGHLGFAAASSATGAIDTRLARTAAGTLSVLASTSTADSTTLGALIAKQGRFTNTGDGHPSLDLRSANVGWAGNIHFRESGGSTYGALASSVNRFYLGATGPLVMTNVAGTVGSSLDFTTTDGTLRVMNRDANALANLQASGLSVKGFAGQTGSLTEWWDSANSAVAKMSASGNLSCNSLGLWGGTPPASKPTLPTNPTNAEIAALLSTYGLCTLV